MNQRNEISDTLTRMDKGERLIKEDGEWVFDARIEVTPPGKKRIVPLKNIQEMERNSWIRKENGDYVITDKGRAKAQNPLI